MFLVELVCADSYKKILVYAKSRLLMYSPKFKLHRVLQGRYRAPCYYHLMNDLLKSLNASYLGTKIGRVVISALGCPDDVISISETPRR